MMSFDRFRKGQRLLTDHEQFLIGTIKDFASAIEDMLDKHQGREAALALTKLEEAVMWAVKAITI